MTDVLKGERPPYTARGLARRIGASVDYVLKEIRDGRLPAFRRGKRFMIDPRDAREWIEGLRVHPQAEQIVPPSDGRVRIFADTLGAALARCIVEELRREQGATDNQPPQREDH